MVPLFGKAFSAPNIGFAKEYISTIGPLTKSCYRYALNKLVEHWGYEFDIDEVNRDYIFGGWFYKTENYLRTAISELESFRDDDMNYITSVYDAVKARSLMRVSRTLTLDKLGIRDTKLGNEYKIYVLKKLKEDYNFMEMSLLETKEDLFDTYRRLNDRR
jgi:hypothetical protein